MADYLSSYTGAEVDAKLDKVVDMVASGSSHKGGLVPDPGSTAGTTKFLREDGSWQVPNYPTSLPANGGNAATVNNHTVATDVPSGAVFTDTTYVFNTAYNASTNKAATMADVPSVSGKADKVEVVSASPQPSTYQPNTVYRLGTLTGTVTINPFASVAAGDSEAKVWCLTFSTSSTAPTITWPAAITDWAGGDAPDIVASKDYELSVMDGIGVIIEA